MLVAVRAGWRRRYACCSDTLKMKRPKPIEPSPVCYRPLSWLMTTILGTIFDDQVGAFNSEGETNSKSHPCHHALCAHCESINFCQGGNRLRWWLIDPCKTVQPSNGRRLSSWSSGAALRSGAAASRTWCQPCALFDVLLRALQDLARDPLRVCLRSWALSSSTPRAAQGGTRLVVRRGRRQPRVSRVSDLEGAAGQA